MNIFDLQATISLNAANFESGVQQAQTAFEGLGSKIDAGAVALGSVMASAVTTAASGLADFGKSAITTGMNFDTAMSNVKAISGATGEEFDELRDKAKRMGATTAFTATEAAEAFSYMAMAGWKTEDMLSGIEGIMNLAAASGEDLATTSDIVTDALTAFGLSAEDSGHFADVLAAASSAANTNVGMMGETFKYVAPVAGALGYSVEDMATAIGTMANSGIKGSQAGTALRAALSRLVKPTDQVAAALSSLGLMETAEDGMQFNAVIQNADGTMVPFSESVERLRNAFSGLSEAEMAQYASTIFGQEAMSGMLAIINSSASDYETLATTIGGASEVMDGMGTAAAMAETQLDNLGGKVTIFQSAMDGLKTALYDTFSGTLASGIEHLTTVIDTLRTGFESGGLLGAVTAFGGLVKGAFDDIVESVSSVTAPLNDLFGAFEEASGGAISTFTGALGEFASTVASVSADTVEAIATGVKNFIGAFDSSEVAGIIGTIAGAVADLFGTLMSIQSSIVEDLGNAIKTFLDAFDYEGAASAISSIASKAAELFSAFSSAVAERIKSIAERFSGFATKIAELATKFPVDFQKIGQAVSGFIENVAKIGQKFEEFTRPIREFFGTVLSTLIQGAVGIVVGAAGGIINAFADIVDFINNSLGAAIALLSGDFEGAAEKVKAAWGNIVEFFKDIWQGIKGAFSGAKSAFEGIGQNIVEGLKSGISGAWSSFLSWIGEKFSGITSFVMGIFGEHSPSKVFASIGFNLVAGMEKGWSSEFGDLERMVGADMTSLTGTARIGFEDSAIGRSSAAGITSLLTANSGTSSQPVEVNLVLDGEVAAKVLYDPLRNVAWQKGKAEAVYA